MCKPYPSQPLNDTAKADLDEMDANLGHLLPPVLLGRFHPEVLRRWAYLRCCVASAQEGDCIASLEAMHLAVENLASIVERRFGPRRSRHALLTGGAGRT